MFDKFCHVVADPLCTHHGPGFGDIVKLLNLRWPLNVMATFYIFVCKATKSEFYQRPFCIGENIRSGVE